ncbi:MAG TPA: ABC transporter substrate-binding protein [Pseudolabrys sp.]|nr:ABC transporter substrate-binding protein [Pseudolabrys sp.]
MRRRQFIALLGGAATWPVVVRAQQNERVRRVGVLLPSGADDPEYEARMKAFTERLVQLGWVEGRNVQIEKRWGKGNTEQTRKFAAELVALAPDVILAPGSSATGPLLQATSSIPIVFATVPDPVAAGYIDSLSRPGGNATGFASFEYSIGGKWLELLKEIAPSVTRVAVIRDNATAAGVGQVSAIQTVASSLHLELAVMNFRSPADLESAVAAFARPSSAMLVGQGGGAIVHRKSIVALAAKYRLPTVYVDRIFVTLGGLMSYGPDRVDQYRQAAGYVDRILKGEKPADLPVQTPNKYELVINLKTAKALGLNVPPSLLARADEVIE